MTASIGVALPNTAADKRVKLLYLTPKAKSFFRTSNRRFIVCKSACLRPCLRKAVR